MNSSVLIGLGVRSKISLSVLGLPGSNGQGRHLGPLTIVFMRMEDKEEHPRGKGKLGVELVPSDLDRRMAESGAFLRTYHVLLRTQITFELPCLSSPVFPRCLSVTKKMTKEMPQGQRYASRLIVR